MNKEEREQYIEKGIQLLSEGKLALVLLAGGQVNLFNIHNIGNSFKSRNDQR